MVLFSALHCAGRGQQDDVGVQKLGAGDGDTVAAHAAHRDGEHTSSVITRREIMAGKL
jgi:hypothetical protein